MSPIPFEPTVRQLLAAVVLAAVPLVGGAVPATAAVTAAPPAPPPANPALVGAAPPATAALGAAPPALPQLWRWPLLPAPRVLRAYDPPARPWLPGHRGVDLAAFPGQPVLSAATGVVVFAGPLAGRGVVSVEHGGIRSSYEPVVPLVRPGDRVVVGQPLALVAPLPRHCRQRTCLHWGAFVTLSVPRRYIDPRVLVGAGPVRLVPAGAHSPRLFAPRLFAPLPPVRQLTTAATASPTATPTTTGPVADPRVRASTPAPPGQPVRATSRTAPRSEPVAAAAAVAGVGALGGAVALGLTRRTRRRR